MDQPQSSSRENPWIAVANGAVFYALAFLVAVTLHELGHATFALAVGVPSVVYHGTFVTSIGADDHQMWIGALGGPLVSCVLAAITLPFVVRPRIANALARGALTWFALTNLMTTMGALMQMPFFNDLNIVANILDIPAAVRWASLGVGMAGVWVVGWLAAASLLTFADADSAIDDSPKRRKLLVRNALLPWILGTLVVAPVSHTPTLTTLVLIMMMGDYTAVAVLLGGWVKSTRAKNGLGHAVAWPAIALLAVLGVLFQTIFNDGVTLR